MSERTMRDITKWTPPANVPEGRSLYEHGFFFRVVGVPMVVIPPRSVSTALTATADRPSFLRKIYLPERESARGCTLKDICVRGEPLPRRTLEMLLQGIDATAEILYGLLSFEHVTAPLLLDRGDAVAFTVSNPGDMPVTLKLAVGFICRDPEQGSGR